MTASAAGGYGGRAPRAPTGVRFRVIEALMFAALGFLVAALIALLIIPAVNARAERLARRRLEALFPLSITELTAEKDHLRAEFAVLQRRLRSEERRVGKECRSRWSPDD